MLKISHVKHSFFNKSSKKLDDFSFKENDFNLSQFNAEFSSLYKLIIANKKHLKKESEIILYANYMCNLMIRYYQNDYVEENLRVLEENKKEIEKIFQENSSSENQCSPHKISSFLLDDIRNNIVDFAYSFTSSAKIRGHVSNIITNRSYWNYSRALANYLIIFLVQSGFADFIKEINEKMGHHYTPDDLIRLLNKTQGILRVLSFALYALRFIMHLITMIKHITQAAMNKELSSKKVLMQEIEKRGYIMTNDMIWGTVNLLSNYNQFFAISSLVVAQINMFFLTVDIMLFVIRWRYEKSQHNCHTRELMLQKDGFTSSLGLAMANRQLDILNDEWEAQRAFYMINIATANLLAIAYGATLVLSGPLSLGCLAALSMLGNALYNTADEYKKYKQASIAVKREIANGKRVNDEHHRELLDELTIECCQAHRIFWKTLLFNTAATAFMITAAATSWPIACALTISYMVYRLQNAYQKHQHRDDKQQVTHDIYRLFSLDQPDLTTTPPLTQLCL
ncbi:coiled-coil protein [Legionella lansingensis]|uniref:Coiled-coil protein n=1 Tax=Legionella lansingensis TaxID=45067 RepID=A0A0W0VZC0_9GAMM|nr:hypothetical protein [Legionella lansingensis]KTD25391.1 coiled-coil protein [Legionella lansingensis]SNV51337.1 coiled-coil protein [Legionella lansingensis]